jgi:hypothetical protein
MQLFRITNASAGTTPVDLCATNAALCSTRDKSHKYFTLVNYSCNKISLLVLKLPHGSMHALADVVYVAMTVSQGLLTNLILQSHFKNHERCEKELFVGNEFIKWNSVLLTFSFIIEGTSKKMLRFLKSLEPIYNKNFCLNEE